MDADQDYDSDESFDSDEEQGVTNSMGERVNALKRTYSHKCSTCNQTTNTKVSRQCTCWTGCKWTALIMFFCYCICCICLYTPFVRGGAIADYLECKCLHRSIVHKCGNNLCNAIIKVYHPDIAGHKHTNKDSDSEDSHSSYYDSEEDNDEVKAEEPEILFPESNKAE